MARSSKWERAAKQARELESRARAERAHAECRAIVAQGSCPDCGSGLRRNSSLAGWYQCEQYGAEGFRKDSAAPSCNWQGFTE